MAFAVFSTVFSVAGEARRDAAIGKFFLFQMVAHGAAGASALLTL
jgi:hypothetical protein